MMGNDQSANLVYAVIVLMLVGSSLLARQLPLKDTARMALAWVAIFGLLFLGFSFRPELKMMWQRVTGAASTGSQTAQDGTLRVTKGEDGHYSVDTSVNGSAVRFLIDTGATTTSLSGDAARKANISIDEGRSGVAVETANGVVLNKRGRIGKFEVGPIVREDFPVLIGEEQGETNLLGMNWLSSLKAWRVEGDVLVLNP